MAQTNVPLTDAGKEARRATERELQSLAVIDRKVMIPMRDGIRIPADIYRPKDTSQKYPVIWVRTPYNFNFWDIRNEVPRDMTAAVTAVKHGYVFIEMQERGEFFAEGEWDVLGGPLSDGEDEIDWMIKQPWSSGKVGTTGCSSTAEWQLGVVALNDPAYAAFNAQGFGCGVGRIGPYYEQGNWYRGGVFMMYNLTWFYENQKPQHPMLGYRQHGGAWGHPDRMAVFVGDLIDRGPDQLATVEVVRAMVEEGAAHCILGNHEFNAVAWATPDLDRPGDFLRSRGKPGNRAQHEAFLAEVEGTPRHAHIIAWFKTLPLWLDHEGLRVVHACWHDESMEVLRPYLGFNNTLSDEAIRLGSRRGHPVFEAIEIVCKGPEITLAADISFHDKGGKVRQEVRVRWWQEDLSTYRKAAIGPQEEMDLIPDVPMPADWSRHGYEGPPVIFGHYWFSGKPQVISDRFACVDYSVAKGGPLVAYRWEGEAKLSNAKLLWVE